MAAEVRMLSQCNSNKLVSRFSSVFIPPKIVVSPINNSPSWLLPGTVCQEKDAEGMWVCLRSGGAGGDGGHSPLSFYTQGFAKYGGKIRFCAYQAMLPNGEPIEVHCAYLLAKKADKYWIMWLNPLCYHSGAPSFGRLLKSDTGCLW